MGSQGNKRVNQSATMTIGMQTSAERDGMILITHAETRGELLTHIIMNEAMGSQGSESVNKNATTTIEEIQMVVVNTSADGILNHTHTTVPLPIMADMTHLRGTRMDSTERTEGIALLRTLLPRPHHVTTRSSRERSGRKITQPQVQKIFATGLISQVILFGMIDMNSIITEMMTMKTM